MPIPIENKNKPTINLTILASQNISQNLHSKNFHRIFHSKGLNQFTLVHKHSIIQEKKQKQKIEGERKKMRCPQSEGRKGEEGRSNHILD